MMRAYELYVFFLFDINNSCHLSITKREKKQSKNAYISCW